MAVCQCRPDLTTSCRPSAAQRDEGCSRSWPAGGGECRPVGSCSLYSSGLCSGAWICCQRGAPSRARPTGAPLLSLRSSAAASSAITFPGESAVRLAPAATPPQSGSRVPSGLAVRQSQPRRRTLLDPPFGEC